MNSDKGRLEENTNKGGGLLIQGGDYMYVLLLSLSLVLVLLVLSLSLLLLLLLLCIYSILWAQGLQEAQVVHGDELHRNLYTNNTTNNTTTNTNNNVC